MFRLPLRERFRGIRHREGVLFRGTQGWAEFAPFQDHSDEHAASWLKAAIEMAFLRIATSGVDCVRSNSIVPEVAADQAVTWAKMGNCSRVKVKVSGKLLDRREDLDRLWAVAKGLSVGSRIRVDLNGACDVDQAYEFAEACEGLPIEYLEQPCGSLEECAALRERINIDIAVDESIRLQGAEADIDQIRKSADVVVLKPIPLGGLLPTKRLFDSLQMPVVISSSLDTSVGLSFVAQVASHLAPEATHGLGTGFLFKEDLTRHSLLPHDGEVHTGPVEPDPSILERMREQTRGAIEDKWHMRFARCWQLLSKDRVLDLVPA